MGESEIPENNEDHADHENALVKAAKESHAAIDDAIRQHMVDIGITGVNTGWVVIAAVTDFEEGTELDGMFATNSEGLGKWPRIGLLTVALEQEKMEDYL